MHVTAKPRKPRPDSYHKVFRCRKRGVRRFWERNGFVRISKCPMTWVQSFANRPTERRRHCRGDGRCRPTPSDALITGVNFGLYSRLLGRLMFVAWVTTNLSQRRAKPLVQLPASVTFILSQHGQHEILKFFRMSLQRVFLSSRNGGARGDLPLG